VRLQLDTFAYTNKLGNLPPVQKLIFALLVLGLSLFAHPLTQVLIIGWMGIWVVVYAQIPLKVYWRSLYLVILFWLSSLPALVINLVPLDHLSRVQTDVYFGLTVGNQYLYWGLQGSNQALEIFLRAIAATSCLYFVMLTVPFNALLRIFTKLGLPLVISEILLLMYRFIFLLLSTATSLWTAQQSRLGYQNLRRYFYSLSLLVRQLFQDTIYQYHQSSLALQTRGFQGKFQVNDFAVYQSSRRYLLESIVGCLFLIGMEFYL
jgi:cobalt/nickel transport system permease protein